MLKKNKGLALMIFVCVFSFWGCSFFPDGTSYVMGDKEAEVHTEEGNRIVGKIDDVTDIDAEVYVPENVEWCNYKVTRGMVDAEKRQQLAAYLCYGMEVPQEVEKESIGEKRYDYKYTDNSLLVFQPTAFTYNTPHHREMQHSSYVLYNQRPRPNIDDLFPNDSIEGFSREEALAVAEQIYKMAGIEVGDNPYIVAIDSEHANNLKKEDELLGVDKNGEKTRDWTKEDEAYFIQYKVKMNGVFLSDCSKNSAKGSYYSNYFNIVVGRDKVIKIDFKGLYEIESSEAIAAEDLCPVSKVVDILASKGYYTKGITAENNIIQISLDYVVEYDEVKNEWRIFPCWICYNDTRSVTEKDGEQYTHSQMR